jgi:thioredoxin 2
MAGPRIDKTGVIVPCPACGRSNRLAFAMLGRASKCGHCKAAVTPPDTPIEVTDAAAFEALSSASALPVIIDFWAPWCGPCRMVAPELERVARETSGRYLVVKVNTDELTTVASRFRISSIPTLAVLNRGREIDRMAGARPAADILAFVRHALAEDERRAS